MKTLKTLFTFFFLINLSFYASAQFGGLKIKKPKLKKPKIAAPKVSNSTKSPNNTAKVSSNNNTTTSSNSSTASNDRNKNGTPKRNDESPIYKAYSKARENIRYAKSTTESTEWKLNFEKASQDVTKYLKKAKEGLDFLNQQASEKDQAYLQQFNTDYETLHKKCTSEIAKNGKVSQFVDHLDDYYSWVSFDAKPSKQVRTYEDYFKSRNAFEAEYPNEFGGDYNQKMVNAVDNFFNVEAYKRLESLEQRVNKTIKSIHEESGGRKRYILSADSYVKDLSKFLQTLAYYKSDLLKDKTAANALEANINKEKDMLQAYIDSGEFEKNKAKYEQEIIDAVRLNKKAMSNSTYERLALDHSFDDGGKIIRAVITSKDWRIAKNNLDIPKYKYLYMSLAVKSKNKCYLAEGKVQKDYEGGGSYAKSRFVYLGIVDEMNCNNVNK